MILLIDMWYTPMTPEWGDGNYNYPSLESLAQALAEFPHHFSPETHKQVAHLVIEQTQNDTHFPNITQPTQTPTY